MPKHALRITNKQLTRKKHKKKISHCIRKLKEISSFLKKAKVNSCPKPKLIFDHM
jgi:hypothetical protein